MNQESYKSAMAEATYIAKTLKPSDCFPLLASGIDYCRALCSIAVVHQMAGERREMDKRFRQAVEMAESPRFRHFMGMPALCYVALDLKAAGHPDADKHFKTALQMMQEEVGAEGDAAVDAQASVAGVYAMQGDIEKARETMESIKCSDLEYLAVLPQNLGAWFCGSGAIFRGTAGGGVH